MFVEFNELPENARIWVYQANRDMNEAEQATVLDFLRAEVNTWVTHGMPMRGSVQIRFDRIILIAADTDFQQPSGCSIDSSTGWLQELGKNTGLNFFDRSIGYFEDGKLKFFSVFEAKKQVSAGTIQPDTQVINLQVSTVRELNNSAVITASESFLSRYFSMIESR